MDQDRRVQLPGGRSVGQEVDRAGIRDARPRRVAAAGLDPIERGFDQRAVGRRALDDAIGGGGQRDLPAPREQARQGDEPARHDVVADQRAEAADGRVAEHEAQLETLQERIQDLESGIAVAETARPASSACAALGAGMGA